LLPLRDYAFQIKSTHLIKKFPSVLFDVAGIEYGSGLRQSVAEYFFTRHQRQVAKITPVQVKDIKDDVMCCTAA
jgi:hypothetical protein